MQNQLISCVATMYLLVVNDLPGTQHQSYVLIRLNGLCTQTSVAIVLLNSFRPVLANYPNCYSIARESSPFRGPQGIICGIWSSEYNKSQGSSNWSFIMRVIFRDLGRRKLATTHDMDFKSNARDHVVVPACIPVTILESIEIDPPPPTASSCCMNFPLSSFLSE